MSSIENLIDVNIDVYKIIQVANEPLSKSEIENNLLRVKWKAIRTALTISIGLFIFSGVCSNFYTQYELVGFLSVLLAVSSAGCSFFYAAIALVWLIKGVKLESATSQTLEELLELQKISPKDAPESVYLKKVLLKNRDLFQFEAEVLIRGLKKKQLCHLGAA